MTKPNPNLKLRLSDLPDDYFEPDAEYYATWLGAGAIERLVVSPNAKGTRLLARISDKKQKKDMVTQADLSAMGKLEDSSCSCGKRRCGHLALTMLVHAAQQREAQQPGGQQQGGQQQGSSQQSAVNSQAPAQQQPSQGRSPKGRDAESGVAQAVSAHIVATQPAFTVPNTPPPALTPVPAPAPARLRGWLSQIQEALGGAGLGRGSSGMGLMYLLSEHRHRNVPTLYVQIRRGDYEAGRWHDEGPFRLPYGLRYDLDNVRELPQYARADVAVLRMLATSATSGVVAGNEAYLLGAGTLSAPLLSGLLETGRLFWQGETEPLRLGPTVRAEMVWQVDERGMQRLRYQVPEGLTRLSVSPPWYRKGQEVGRLESQLSASAEEILVQLPPVAPEDSAALGEAVTAMFGGLVPPPTPITVRRAQLPYRPTLELSYRAPEVRRVSWGTQPKAQPRALARLLHHYGEAGERVQARHYQNGELLLLERDQAAERKAAGQLSRAGFRRLSKVLPPNQKLAPHENPDLLTLENDAQWFAFMESGKAALEHKGFEVLLPSDFPYLLAHIEDWYGEAEEKGGWFTLDLGVVVDGVRVSLLPVLVSLIASRPDLFSPEALAALSDDEVLYAALPDGRKLALPAGRVRSILSIIVELNLKTLPEGPLTLPLLDAARLSQLEDSLRLRWVGAERLLELGKKLRGFAGIQEVLPPKGLNADLRPYQQQGLNWLQFLRETEMGGILADDMGLGKTLQTLAHIQLEKEAGRADLPSLVVAPTSVLYNWHAEATRFTPDLRVLTLHGAARKERFAQMNDYDLILTTYPLLPRDLGELEQHEYHYLILDEAQNIKNAKSASAKAAGGLKARHRLVLTGTPLENHLGELWSLFNFLSPGLLHNEKVFREVYRTPIEKQGDLLRRAALAARIRPFVLRREKGEVARELPPKTEIMVPLTLEGAQRDLYETVRVTMLERVREELAAQGLSRSTIAILDALLKLRQAVTDPRLVKLQAAKGVRQNAKLQWFTEQIPQMVGEGRRILVFSAFATVLTHLEEPLKRMGIPYSKLTGQTKARHEQIEAFQSGQTHVFLISLKAGGVGLNLTAADTVIHYDPWWNPAAENQATDRAYRIGQDKPVFVYKLLASGSVEERILEMQSRKAALAQGVLEGGLSDAGQLTQKDLDRLFAPLEDGEEEESSE